MTLPRNGGMTLGRKHGASANDTKLLRHHTESLHLKGNCHGAVSRSVPLSPICLYPNKHVYLLQITTQNYHGFAMENDPGAISRVVRPSSRAEVLDSGGIINLIPGNKCVLTTQEVGYGL